MTADQPAGGPAPRHLAEGEPLVSPAPRHLAEDAPVVRPAGVAEDAPVVSPAGVAEVAAGPTAAGDIATLDVPPADLLVAPDDPRTGEPRRPVVVTVATVLCWLAVAVTGASVLWVYWNAVPIAGFAQASWLMGQFETEPGSVGRVLLAVAVTAIGIVIGAANAIVGYYAWTGYRWTRIAGLISAALTFGALTLNQPAWAAIPLAVIGAGLLWLPPATRFFRAWHARRHPQPVFAPPTSDVYYGPLPRYR